MDSGEAKLRLVVNGREAGTSTVHAVPAGSSRVDNRAPALFDWKPAKAGTYRLRAEVMDPAAEVSVFLRP